MANTTTSPNMGLVLPTVGVDPGPDWATNLNASLTIIDSHNHSPGNGTQVTPAGLNISSDLSFISNNAINLRSIRFAAQLSPISGSTDLDCLSVSGVDLYYNDGNGNIVRITQSGSIAGTPGSITGLTPPASATYVSGNQTFVWESNVLTPANLDAASIVLRNLIASSNGLTLSPPNAMASSYTITLPSLPATGSLVTIDSSGNMGTVLSTTIIPTGVAIPFTGASAPPSFLFADGSAVSRTTYAALFAIIGTTYGPGNGSTTFNLPNGTGKLTLNAVSLATPSYLHSYWHMDSSANEPNAIQPSGFDLTMVGALPSVPGKFNNARGQFTAGGPDYLLWPASGSSTTPYDSLTFAVDGWFKTAQSGALMAIFSKTNFSSQGWYIAQETTDKIFFSIPSSMAIFSPLSYNDNNWHYFAAANLVTSGANNMRLYIDNVNVASSAGVNMTPTALDLAVGVFPTGSFPGLSHPYIGLIDDISYWNTVPGSWAAFESIINNRWNAGTGALYGTPIEIPVPYIIKT